MNIIGALFPVENFFNQIQADDSLFDHLRTFVPFARKCLFRGDADQCFRSLLFQASISYASIGKRVSFYTPLPVENIPPLVHSLVPNSLSTANLHLIEFHYMSNLFDVHKHLITSSCDIIIIDGYLEFLLSKNDDLFKIMSSCALLCDTYEYVKEKFHCENLVLLCSCTCSDSQMANVERRGLFDLAIDIEMLENGDYRAKINSSLSTDTSCLINFRMNRNEIMPLFTTFLYHNK